MIPSATHQKKSVPPAGEDRQSTVAAIGHIRQVLEEEIVLGVLHPRERLVEDELMARFSTKAPYCPPGTF